LYPAELRAHSGGAKDTAPVVARPFSSVTSTVGSRWWPRRWLPVGHRNGGQYQPHNRQEPEQDHGEVPQLRIRTHLQMNNQEQYPESDKHSPCPTHDNTSLKTILRYS